MPLPQPPFDSDGESDERQAPYQEEVTESFAAKDLDELQDEFDDEEARPSER